MESSPHISSSSLRYRKIEITYFRLAILDRDDRLFNNRSLKKHMCVFKIHNRSHQDTCAISKFTNGHSQDTCAISKFTNGHSQDTCAILKFALKIQDTCAILKFPLKIQDTCAILKFTTYFFQQYWQHTYICFHQFLFSINILHPTKVMLILFVGTQQFDGGTQRK